MTVRVLHPFLFLVGLFGTAGLIRWLDPLPFWSGTRSKAWHYRQHAGEYDTVFLGSSRVHGGVVPREFDARMAELGHPTHSFNLAISGYRPHEVDLMVDWVIANRTPVLKRVIIEAMSWELNVRGGDWMSDMEIESHGPGQFVARCESLLSSRYDAWSKLQQLYHHVLHTLCNTFRIGQARRILADRLALQHGKAPRNTWPVVAEGYVDLGADPPPRTIEQHNQFLADIPGYQRQLAAKRRDRRTPWLDGGFNLRAARAQHQRLREVGIEVIYLVMPTYSTDFFGRDGAIAFGQEVQMLVLDHPEDRPELFAIENWFDPSHMSRQGGPFFSRLLAEAIVSPPPPELPAAPQPAPAVPSAPVHLQGAVTWASGDDLALDLRVEAAPAGDVLAVISAAPADLDLGNGVHAKVALPALAYTILARTGHAAALRFASPGLRGDSPLYVQFAVARAGVWVAVSDRIDVAPKR